MSAKGNEVLLRARSQFRTKRAPDTLQKLDVPEWGVEIFYWPEMDVTERRGVYGPFRGSAEGLVLEGAGLLDAAVQQVLLRARDELGNRLFADGDEAALCDTDPNVLLRISNAMGFGSRPTVEGAEKNS